MAVRRRHASRRQDTLISDAMLATAVTALAAAVRVDRSHDVPYVAGYSEDGRTIYIDRRLPRTYTSGGKRVAVDRFLVLHESIEKALCDAYDVAYPLAHQVAARAEQAAVRGAGHSWRPYERFMQKHIRASRLGPFPRLPADLDLRPYRDEHDQALLRAIAAAPPRKLRLDRPTTEA